VHRELKVNHIRLEKVYVNNLVIAKDGFMLQKMYDVCMYVLE